MPFTIRPSTPTVAAGTSEPHPATGRGQGAHVLAADGFVGAPRNEVFAPIGARCPTPSFHCNMTRRGHTRGIEIDVCEQAVPTLTNSDALAPLEPNAGACRPRKLIDGRACRIAVPVSMRIQVQVSPSPKGVRLPAVGLHPDQFVAAVCATVGVEPSPSSLAGRLPGC